MNFSINLIYRLRYEVFIGYCSRRDNNIMICFLADGSRSPESGLYSHARAATTDHGWFLAIGLGTRQRSDRDADTTHRRRPRHVSPLLARGGIGTLSHLRGTSGIGAFLVRRLPGALLLSQKSTHLWDTNRHAIPLPVLAGEQCTVFHEGFARIPQVSIDLVIYYY